MVARPIAFALSLIGLMPVAQAAQAAQAQEVVTSRAPDSVALTLYRAPGRGAGEAMELDWLQGYALITEQRTVTIPAGQAVVRFEGVAAGMLPESALVRGLPIDIREKNLDAELLSPRNLYARAFGRPVILRRQHPKTGATTEEHAIIRSGPDGAVIVQTKDGFRTALCGPFNESLVYDGVPEGLSARPTLSIATNAAAETRVTIALSYLAWGFDWDANYVIRMEDGDRSASLHAWVTIANSDPTSFPDADMAVVAGGANRTDARSGDSGEDGELIAHCALAPMLPAPAPPELAAPAMMADIIVTARRRSESVMEGPVKVTEEGLGDLKLYRLPIPTTVAAHAQKQVTLHDLPAMKLMVIHAASIWDGEAGSVSLLLRARNRKEDGLGVALPTGMVSLFERYGDADILVGQGALPGKAIGEDVELHFAAATQVHVDAQQSDRGEDGKDILLTVTNANPWPVAFEATIGSGEDHRQDHFSAHMGRRNGYPLWQVQVPAEGRAMLRYRLTTIGN